MIEVFRYQTADGKEPLTVWLLSLRDKTGSGQSSHPDQAAGSGNIRGLRTGRRWGVGVTRTLGCWLPGVFRQAWSDGSDPVVWRYEKITSRRHQDRQGILDRLETETSMSKKLTGAVSHHEREVAELRADRELAVQYLKAAMESLDDPDDRAAGLLALRTVAEAYGGLGAVAAEAGISRESLYRTLSPKGNPTLKTLLAVLKALGMKLSVEPEQHVSV